MRKFLTRRVLNIEILELIVVLAAGQRRRLWSTWLWMKAWPNVLKNNRILF